MRIDPRVPLFQAAAPKAGTRPADGRTFSPETEGSSPAAGARASAPLATLDAILALQGEEDPRERRRRSAKRGKTILDALDELKASILGGRVPPETLGRIARQVGGAASGDPGLDAVIAEIELRAKVELAKLGRFDLC